MIQTAQLLASSHVSFVMESSRLSGDLLAALHQCDATVLAVHVIADETVIRARLAARASKGSAVDEQLAGQFARGELHPSIFRPPSETDAVVDVDTSAGEEAPLQIIESAFLALLTGGDLLSALGTVETVRVRLR